MEEFSEYKKKISSLEVDVICPKKEIFKMYRSPTKEVWEMNFLLQCIPILQSKFNF